eukprot:TRINITY_DN5257_c0_g1_i2.p1 TRINITY_DN5257_c0_g1~~TRINITY_DN5257_c0_g1_i2.p1  ORF type:complete len:543 (-),score=125.10 TRINITY_DN5257_c0_g1_i2:924-2552(-)
MENGPDKDYSKHWIDDDFDKQTLMEKTQPYDPATFSDVFGGPPSCIYSGKLWNEALLPASYDEIFRVKDLEKKKGLSRNKREAFALPVFELPERSSLSGNGGSSLPVFEIPSFRKPLDTAFRASKLFGDAFYDDIFKGSDSVEDATNKNSLSWSSCSSLKDDRSLSAFQSKLRPVSVTPKQEKRYAFNRGNALRVPSRESDDASFTVCSSSTKSSFSDTAEEEKFVMKTRNLSHFKSSPMEATVREISNGNRLKKLDTNLEEEFSATYSHDSCNFKLGSYDPICHVRESVHILTPPPSPVSRQKSWRDLKPQTPISHYNSNISLPRKIASCYVSPAKDDSYQSKTNVPAILDVPEKHEDNSCRVQDYTVTSDASDMAVKEAIAWAKEKFMLGKWKSEQENMTKSSSEENQMNEIEVKRDATEYNAGNSQVFGERTGSNTNEVDNQDQDPIKKEIGLQMQEIEFVSSESVDIEESFLSRVSSKDSSRHNQYEDFEEDVDPLFHAPELQGACVIDSTFDISTTIEICDLLEDRVCCRLDVMSLG